jgi:hypothetical protein
MIAARNLNGQSFGNTASRRRRFCANGFRAIASGQDHLDALLEYAGPPESAANPKIAA